MKTIDDYLDGFDDRFRDFDLKGHNSTERLESLYEAQVSFIKQALTEIVDSVPTEYPVWSNGGKTCDMFPFKEVQEWVAKVKGEDNK
jgi:hypothetical protein